MRYTYASYFVFITTLLLLPIVGASHDVRSEDDVCLEKARLQMAHAEKATKTDQVNAYAARAQMYIAAYESSIDCNTTDLEESVDIEEVPGFGVVVIVALLVVAGLVARMRR